MQGLLARLKTAREQSGLVNGQTQPSEERVDDERSKLLLNNFFREKDVSNQLPKADELRREPSVESIIDLSDSRSTSRTDDVIDIVMASNKTKSRNNSTASTKHLKKNSKTRGSRVSLNSVTLSEKEDLDLSGMESDDDAMATRRTGRVVTPAQAWAAFEETVKNIDCSNPDQFAKKPKPNFLSSGAFQQVMTDMYGNSEYGNTRGYTLLKKKLNSMARASTLATRVFAHASAKGQEERENEQQQHMDEVDAANTEAEPETATKIHAKRGWKMVKRQVQETVMEQKTQSTKLNWTMLQHTMKQMTNVERTRQDLYERYGIVPTVMEDGTVSCVNRMLSERARAQLQGKENKRPMSYQPPPTHLRSQSQAGYQKNVLRKGAKLPNVKNKRPVTAKR